MKTIIGLFALLVVSTQATFVDQQDVFNAILQAGQDYNVTGSWNHNFTTMEPDPAFLAALQAAVGSSGGAGRRLLSQPPARGTKFNWGMLADGTYSCTLETQLTDPAFLRGP